MDALPFLSFTALACLLTFLGTTLQKKYLIFAGAIFFVTLGAILSAEGISWQNGLTETATYSNITSATYDALGNLTATSIAPYENQKTTTYSYALKKDIVTDYLGIILALFGITTIYFGLAPKE